MTSSIDSNVLIALWDTDSQNVSALAALDEAALRGPSVVCGAVYAELLGGFGRSKERLDGFFQETGIEVDWTMDRRVWEMAGVAYQEYCARRRKRRDGVPRRMPTDFLIGAHAMRHGHGLVTQDKSLYRAAYPELKIYYA